MCPCKQLDLHTARLDSFAAYKCIAVSMACWIFYSPLGHPLSFLLTLNAFPNSVLPMKNIKMSLWQNSTEKSERLKIWFHSQNMALKDWSFVFITQPDSFSSRHENLCSVIMNTCLHSARKWHRNLSDMWWPSTFKIGLREITILMCEQ